MRNLFYLLLVTGLFTISACGDEDPIITTPNYIITLISPDTEDKKVGDMITLEVNVKDDNGGTVHHFNLKIYNKADVTDILYEGPAEAHVHEEDGDFTYTDDIHLDVAGDTDWVVEAKVWGHEAGAAEKTQTLEFHVHPNPPVYVINIVNPTTDDRKVGDTIPLEINIKEDSGKTVHHFNLKIYNKVDNTDIIYNGPAEAHVHEEDGDFTFTDNIELNVAPDTDWVVEAKVWGHEAGLAEKIETVEFHVHPM